MVHTIHALRIAAGITMLGLLLAGGLDIAQALVDAVFPVPPKFR